MANINKENKSSYWIRKFDSKRWTDFREVEVGSIFETSVSNHVQMADRIGDIIFWYRKDKEQGIYFITEVIAEPKKDDAYQNGWSMSLKVIKTLIHYPVKLNELNNFKSLIEKINKMGQGGSTYNLTLEDEPERLMNLILDNEKVEFGKSTNTKIDSSDLETMNKLRDEYINGDTIFNPFLDMNLVRNEVGHLSFLTNLIDPDGSHLQKDKFLKLFIDEIIGYDLQLDNKYLKNFCNNANINVQIERNIGDGRIDIWIENDEYIIAIEGKTETVDSKGQLKKYDNYLKEQNKPYLLIYLTVEGEEPTDIHPDNLQLMSFRDDILAFIENVLSIEDLPQKINYIIDEYYNALISYVYDFNKEWIYDLKIIDEISKDNNSYEKYENMKNNYYYDSKKYKSSVVEDITRNFEKTKAKIERDFIYDLADMIDDNLIKEGFEFSFESNIITKTERDTPEMHKMIEINNIEQFRQNRLKDYDYNQEQSCVDEHIQNTKCEVIYENKISDIQTLYVAVRNDFEGLNVYFQLWENDVCINYFADQYVELLYKETFSGQNIALLLDKKYSNELLTGCKSKILDGLKQIEI